MTEKLDSLEYKRADVGRGPHDIHHRTEHVSESQVERWGEEVCRIACRLGYWLGMYSFDVTRLSFHKRAQMAEKIHERDRKTFFWYCGRHGIDPKKADSLWDNAMEDLEGGENGS